MQVGTSAGSHSEQPESSIAAETGRQAPGPLSFLVKASRPGLWATAAWFYLLPVARHNVFPSWWFWLGLAYFTFPFGLLLYGWNDLGDRATDRRNPRKGNFVFGAKGDDDELARLPPMIALVQVPFLAAFALRVGILPTCFWFAALLLANFLYNDRPFLFKNRAPFELLNQVGYLLVFVMGSWLNRLPALPWQTFVFGALFAMQAHLFGQIMDIAPDAETGRRTTAIRLGVVRAKWLLVAFLIVESVFLLLEFHNWLVGGALLCAAAWFTLDALVLVRDRPYTPRELHLFALGLNVGMVGSMGWVWASGSLSILP